ncbi:MAG: hypothetical protein ABJZ69_16280 [Hyphomicrobiales bacterium]
MGSLAGSGVPRAASAAAVSVAAAPAIYAGVAESEEGGGPLIKAEYIGLGIW